MRINNNVIAINTHRQYTVNTNSVAKSTEKLSSGYRVNRAGDDAAGLAISEKMRAQIRGLNMASKNSSDAISLVQTAEGALQETHNILQRMRELATQSASDTNETSIDRAALNAEFQQLIKEIDDTAKKTRFNDMGVIDGSYGDKGTYMDASSLTGNTDKIVIGSVFMTLGDGVSATSVQVTVSATQFQFVSNDGTFTVKLDSSHLTAGSHHVSFSDGTSFAYQLKEEVTSANLVSYLGTVTFSDYAEGNMLTIQTGANQGDELAIKLASMDAKTLGLMNAAGDKAYGIATREEASNAITLTNTAINLVSTERAKLGALQNRLNHKIMNLDTSSENLSAAESRIRDLDMAKEMTNFTRNNILVQASTAMLAQANMIPQSVLSLIG